MKTTSNLKSKIAAMPDTAGVYLMKDKSGNIVYVGKAKSLKRRVSSYFCRGFLLKTAMLMPNVCDIEYRLCPTESMALLLEASIIHKYKPKYNISLRDDKSFPLVKITNEEFPAICVTRKKEVDGSRYIGPFTSASLLREALRIIRRNFPYRVCGELPEEARIYHKIGLSPGAALGGINKKEYLKTIKNIILLLEGRTEDLIKKLSREMVLKSKDQRYEEAAKIRDQITALSAIGQANTFAGSQFELECLKSLLKLKRLPGRIEAFDISNIYGKEATGSMVSFYRGIADKNNYRKFRIKTVNRADDYKMLFEVVHRRYSRLIAEKLPLPDLIIIDGGRAHLLTAQKALKNLGLNIPLASIAKPSKKADGFMRAKVGEHIYTKDSPQPVKLKKDIAALNLLRRVRDEAHRFANFYHHILRRKKIIGK
ncbi:MAG: GIY-YIG nuclease family protein [Candidatus Omnitrophota bacterium]